jgi:hypothetical protein
MEVIAEDAHRNNGDFVVCVNWRLISARLPPFNVDFLHSQTIIHAAGGCRRSGVALVGRPGRSRLGSLD